MNSGSAGGFTHLKDDECAYNRHVTDSTAPMLYRLYEGAFEHCQKCKYDKFWHPYDPEMVDVESELKNITRASSRCTERKYNPNCQIDGKCMSTFDTNAPVIFPPHLCPVVQTNIVKMTEPGYVLPTGQSC